MLEIVWIILIGAVVGALAKFLMPGPSDLRYHWVVAGLGELDETEMRELVVDAWTMVVPTRVAADHLGEPAPPARVRGGSRPSGASAGGSRRAGPRPRR